MADYIQSRKGRKRLAISPTRRNIVIITTYLAEHRIKTLETNLFSKPTAKARHLLLHDKSTVVFDYLLQAIKPRIILVHGK
jgi:hypothetical protein